jgi:hypothetical protein
VAVKPRQPVPSLEFDTIGGGREMVQAIDFALSKNYPARGEA